MSSILKVRQTNRTPVAQSMNAEAIWSSRKTVGSEEGPGGTRHPGLLAVGSIFSKPAASLITPAAISDNILEGNQILN